jgi:EAL domain-containing protein (putative c-di-GMP-specific phosphodiesterase class I)/GGDEF domain-containing protein
MRNRKHGEMMKVVNLRAYSALEECPTTSVRDLLMAKGLQPHFQPIVQLSDGAIFAHEALIRTPPGCLWKTPDELFAAARAEGSSIDLEIECVRLSLQAWARHPGPGKLFVNLSARALTAALARRDNESELTLFEHASVIPRDLVVELTEHEQVQDYDALAVAVGRLRRKRITIALDDFGDGRSSLRLWSELKPEIVKIDKYFTRELLIHPEKLQTLKALQQISQTLGSTLVAEGIETPEELHLVRDLGIGLGQGWLLGRPKSEPRHIPTEEGMTVIRRKAIAVFPERRRPTQQRAKAWNLLHETPSVPSVFANDELFKRFNEDGKLQSVAIVDDGHPLGIVSRQRFIDSYAKRFFRELHGRKPCTLLANLAPRLVEVNSGLDELTTVLTSEDQRYLTEGVILTEGGRYRSLGTGQELVRTVTEARIEAARHVNPLTLLPGNIPITQHIQRLLLAESRFVACYADLNQFKPFNDIYGFCRGDEMILLAAKALTEHADPTRDFLGHVGGDDFIVLFQSDDWEQRCHALVEQFNRRAAELYDDEARAACGVNAEDRYGIMHFHPLTTMSIGAFRVIGSPTMRVEDIANASARAKRLAKGAQVALYLDNPYDITCTYPLSGRN